jgi:hypothetical protein
MKPRFSEFSYGFALAHEICVCYHHFHAAPELPSLSSEGDSGFDIRFPLFALFLQFKRSDYLRASNAKQMAEMGAPYYRAELWERSRSDQHKLLVELDHSGNTVLYACSAFHLPADLDRCFRSRATEANTAFFRPSDIGELPDDEPHCIAFEADKDFGVFFSEPKRVARQSLPEFLEPRMRKQEAVLAEDLLKKMIEIQKKVASPTRSLWGQDEFAPDTRSPLARAGLLSRIVFGCELLVAGSPNSAMS